MDTKLITPCGNLRPIELHQGESHIARLVVEHKPDGTQLSHNLCVVTPGPEGLHIAPFERECAATLWHDSPLHIIGRSLYEE